LGLPTQQLRFLRSLTLHPLAQLLRGHHRLRQRRLPLAILLHLRLELCDPLLQPPRLVDHLLQAIRDQVEEQVHIRGAVPPERSREITLLLPNIDRRQVDHFSRSPNRIVPSRTRVAPSSTAISKSFDIPIDRCTGSKPATSEAQRSNNLRADAKVLRNVASSDVNGAIVMSPRIR